MREKGVSLGKTLVLTLILASVSSVYLSLRTRPQPELNLELSAAGGSAVLRITDVGKGAAELELIVIRLSRDSPFLLRARGLRVDPGETIQVDLGVDPSDVEWVSVITLQGDCFSARPGAP